MGGRASPDMMPLGQDPGLFNRFVRYSAGAG
jgi:hypothetical protein